MSTFKVTYKWRNLGAGEHVGYTDDVVEIQAQDEKDAVKKITEKPPKKEVIIISVVRIK